MNRNIKYSLFSIGLLLFFALPLLAYSPKNRVKIHWNRGLITSEAYLSIKKNKYGIDNDFKNNSINRIRINAYKEVKESGILNLASAISNIYISKNFKIKDMMNKNPYVQRELSRVLAEKTITQEYPDGHLTVKSEAKLKISDILVSLPIDFPEKNIPGVKNRKYSTAYTSIIIDTRGIGIRPMLLPSIYDEDGLEIYSKYYVNAREAVNHGLVKYCYNEKEANKNRAAGSRPFFTVAIKNLNGSPVLSHSDIVKILSSKKTVVSLKKCHVIFIIDKPGKKSKMENF